MADTTMIGMLFFIALICCAVVHVDSLTKTDAKYKRFLRQDYTSKSNDNKVKDNGRRDDKYKLVKRLKGDMGSYAMDTDNVFSRDVVRDAQRPKGYMPYRMRHRYFGGKRRDESKDIVTSSYENEGRANRFDVKNDGIAERTFEKRITDADAEENNYDIIDADNLFQNGGRLEDSNYIIIPDDVMEALDAETRKRDSAHAQVKRNLMNEGRYSSTSHDTYHMEDDENSNKFVKKRDMPMKKSTAYGKLNNDEYDDSEDIMEPKDSFSALNKDRKVVSRQLATDTSAEWEALLNNQPADVELNDEKSFEFAEK